VKMNLNLQQKNELLNILIIVFFIIIIASIILMVSVFIKGFQCSQNPLVYGVNQYSNPEIYCTCYSKNPAYRGFIVQNDGIYDFDLYGSSSDPSFFIKSSSDK
jgi:flagellar basal body-associated protein FliL